MTDKTIQHKPANPCRDGSKRRPRTLRDLFGLLLAGWLAGTTGALAQVTDTTVRVGGVMALQGAISGLGQNMKAGLEAAFKGATVQGRGIEFGVLNDSYNPPDTVEATRKLLADGVFAMVGNVGTPTASVALPILAEQKIPAVGFYTGADLLRPGIGDVINFRASYTQEIAAVIDAALRAGVKPQQVCAFVQNDSFGMAGMAGIKMALGKQPGTEATIVTLEKIIAMPGESPQRNNIGPVGVYARDTLFVRDGYQSLKTWEQTTGNRCRLVVTVGVYEPIAQFMAYARKLKNEPWVISAPSVVGAESLKDEFRKYGIQENIIVTQVVPALDSPLPIVESARKALGDKLGYISLEGYIVGRMFLAILDKAGGTPTPESFVRAARGQQYDLDGLKLDFSDDNQGSDFVLITLLSGDDFAAIEPRDLENMFVQ